MQHCYIFTRAVTHREDIHISILPQRTRTPELAYGFLDSTPKASPDLYDSASREVLPGFRHEQTKGKPISVSS